MRSGITAIVVLLIGLSCHAQSDETDNWWTKSWLLKEWGCLDETEDIERIEDLNEECQKKVKNMIETRELAEQKTEELAERFRLYNGCLPMNLIVEDLSDDAKEIGLNWGAIQNALESRLRGAHLYSTLENLPETWKRASLLFPDKEFAALNTAQLYVRVSVVGLANNITLAYKKWVADELSGVGAYATTWETGSFGIAAEAGFIMNYLAEHVDQFLVEFLRVNEVDCQPSRP